MVLLLHQVDRRVEDASDQLLVGTSLAMRRLRAALDRLASQDISILIRGESGTGKELVARALHERGVRRNRRFVALNCGAISDTLIASELFGHARGAYSGATLGRPGLFVEADGGALFLDEIDSMPLHAQAHLLRVLQEREVRPIGSAEVRKVDVRVIAATHVDLRAAVDAGRFREDLFYRLNLGVDAIVQCFQACAGDLDAMVAQLQVSRRALSRRLHELGLPRRMRLARGSEDSDSMDKSSSSSTPPPARSSDDDEQEDPERRTATTPFLSRDIQTRALPSAPPPSAIGNDDEQKDRP